MDDASAERLIREWERCVMRDALLRVLEGPAMFGRAGLAGGTREQCLAIAREGAITCILALRVARSDRVRATWLRALSRWRLEHSQWCVRACDVSAAGGLAG